MTGPTTTALQQRQYTVLMDSNRLQQKIHRIIPPYRSFRFVDQKFPKNVLQKTQHNFRTNFTTSFSLLEPHQSDHRQYLKYSLRARVSSANLFRGPRRNVGGALGSLGGRGIQLYAWGIHNFVGLL